MMPEEEFTVRPATDALGMSDDDEETPRGAARAVVAAWAVSWAGTVVVAMAWLVSLTFGDTGDEGFSWVPSYLLIVLVFTVVPAVIGLVLLLVPAVLGSRRPVPDWVVVVAATVVGGVAGPLLGLSVQTGLVPALIGSTAGIAVLRLRSTPLRWTVAAGTLALVLAVGRAIPML